MDQTTDLILNHKCNNTKLTLNLVDRDNNNYQYQYDNKSCTIFDQSGNRVMSEEFETLSRLLNEQIHKHHDKCDKDLLTKYNNPSHIRISLGSKCNFTCKYCKQERDTLVDVYSEDNVVALVDLFKEHISGENIEHIQFWGGEPLVYKNTVLSLAQKFHEVYPHAELFTLSNGSMWTEQFVEDAINSHLMLGISHDGPGQCYRTADPLKEGSASRAAIMKYWEHVKSNPSSMFSILVTMTDKNTVNFFETEKYFVDIFGEEILTRLNFLPLMIDNEAQHSCQYDYTLDNKISYRVLEYLITRDLKPSGMFVQFSQFAKLFSHKDFFIDPKQVSCFMASPISLVVDMYGNVIPCQNYNIGTTIFGMSPKMGHISDLSKIVYPKYIQLDQKETKCLACPVVAMCMGGCPLNRQKYLSEECKSNFVFYLGLFAYIVYLITGKILVSVDGDFSCKDI